MGALTDIKKSKELICAVEELERFLKSYNDFFLLEQLNYEKHHLKERIIFRGTFSTQKEYLDLWRESDSYMNWDSKRLRVLLIYKIANKNRNLSLLLLRCMAMLKTAIGKYPKGAYLK